MKPKSIILIVTGILIASYPVVKDIYTSYLQKKILYMWETEKDSGRNDASDAAASDDEINSYIRLNEVFSELNDTESSEPEKENNGAIDGEIVTLGVIKIDKINLKLPVMDGATPEILKIGAGKLTGTSNIGEIGNTAISAHRSHKYGRNFNRLNELEKGDIVTISTLEADYTYEVFNILVVEPDDVSVLKKSKTESILTLITCHPLYTASHRLIVQARLISTVYNSESE